MCRPGHTMRRLRMATAVPRDVAPTCPNGHRPEVDHTVPWIPPRHERPVTSWVGAAAQRACLGRSRTLGRTTPAEAVVRPPTAHPSPWDRCAMRGRIHGTRLLRIGVIDGIALAESCSDLEPRPPLPNTRIRRWSGADATRRPSTTAPSIVGRDRRACPERRCSFPGRESVSERDAAESKGSVRSPTRRTPRPSTAWFPRSVLFPLCSFLFPPNLACFSPFVAFYK
jgi:hypothetical protein